ncbi:MAG: winged helix-turn-helix transcriptional regulator [Phycisphaerales bacterium JB052]
MSENDPSAATGYEQSEAFHRVTDILKCKWALAILNLLDEPMRPSQILDALPGLTSKVLNDRLRKLESFELVSREVYPEVPPRVEYALTGEGHELKRILADLIAFIGRSADVSAG